MVTADFSTAMNAPTINGTSFTLKDSLNNPVPATVTYNAITNRATLTPNAALAGLTTYTASLSAAIQATDVTTPGAVLLELHDDSRRCR